MKKGQLKLASVFLSLHRLQQLRQTVEIRLNTASRHITTSARPTNHQRVIAIPAASKRAT